MSTQDARKQLPYIKTDLEENATGAIYQVIKEFNARLEDELSLRLGDKIEVISDDKEFNDGWYMGKSLSTGAVGLYPKAFTQLVPSLSRPTLLRARSRRIASPSSSTQSPLPTKSNSATPISTRTSSKFEDNTPKLSPQQEVKHSQISGALSDIDKALEELKNEAKPGYGDSSFSETSESLNPELVESWTPDQVTSYFKYLGFDSRSSEQFAEHKITGAILLELELAYLKELDISSFGTRFEIYKEIEALKELAEQRRLGAQHTFDEEDDEHSDDEQQINSKSLLAAPEFHRKDIASGNNQNGNIEQDLDTFTRPLGHMRKKSKSLDDIPETSKKSIINPQTNRNRNSYMPPSSQVPEVPTSKINNQFLSPRPAPSPPAYPSPIQLREEFQSSQNTPTNPRRSSQVANHSRKPSYDVNPAFQLRGNHSRNASYDQGHSRQNSRNFKSASTADLLTNFGQGDRPASSIYLDSTHSRHSSVNLRTTRHSRHTSEVSIKRTEKEEKSHRRHSSVFSFLSNSNMLLNGPGNISPTRTSSARPASFFGGKKISDSPTKSLFLDHDEPSIHTLDPKASASNQSTRRSVSAKEADDNTIPSSPNKRSVSEAVKQKSLRNISSSATLRKAKTSAFMEGIRNISPSESIKTSDCFGWMNKKGGIAVGTWKQRYFTLHGTRLSYFTSLSDTRERGLIDITSHKVLPAKDDDKFVSLYAASTGNGKFCFKLVPPAPGSRKGLTFTQPKVHYFAVETREEMRTWMAALIKATIDIDESVPVISSCATPTVSLQKAQTMLAQARENVKKREELNRLKENELNKPELSGNSSISPDTDSYDSTLPIHSPNTTVNTSEMTPILNSDAGGFGSPFDIASNPYTPKSNNSSAKQSPIDTEFKSKPYSASQRVVSSSASAAAAAAFTSQKSKTNRI